jgi:hypothetical protein
MERFYFKGNILGHETTILTRLDKHPGYVLDEDKHEAFPVWERYLLEYPGDSRDDLHIYELWTVSDKELLAIYPYGNRKNMLEKDSEEYLTVEKIFIHAKTRAQMR